MRRTTNVSGVDREPALRGARRQGFTLLELIVALALAGLLMVSVVGVLRSITRQRQALVSQHTLQPWRTRLIEQLRWELTNSRRLAASPRQLRLVGYAGRNFETGEPTYRPTEIIYILRDTADHESWLVREEVHLDEATNVNRRRDVMCQGITTIEIRDWDDTGPVEAPAVANPVVLRLPPTRVLGEMPDRFRLILNGPAGQPPVFDEVIIHHRIGI